MCAGKNAVQRKELADIIFIDLSVIKNRVFLVNRFEIWKFIGLKIDSGGLVC